MASASAFYPKTTATYNLGGSLFKWKQGFFSENVTSPLFTGNLVGGVTGNITGNADTATILENTRTFSFTGAVTAASQNFNGSSNVTFNVTGLNASNLNSGTVPNARISGSYTNFVDAEGSGYSRFIRFRGVNSGNATVPVFTFDEDGDTGIYRQGANVLSITTGGEERLRVGSSGNITAISGAFIGTHQGDGSGITNLNASNLGSGTVPNGRISGNYDNINDLTISGTLKISGVGTVSSPDITLGTGTAIYRPSSNVIMFATGGTDAMQIGGNNIRIKPGYGLVMEDNGPITGNGANIISLNASQLTSGIVPNGRLSGAYTGLTGTGALNSGSITSGFGNINIGSNSFTGNGNAITNINAANILDDNEARNLVRLQIAKTGLGSVGSYAMLGRITGSTGVAPGDTIAGSSLRYVGIVQASGGDVEIHASGGTPSGVWMCVGFLDNWTAAASLFVRIS